MGAFLSWSPTAGPSKSLFFDVCTEEAQELSSTATEYPVEDGANVSDHVKRELDRVTLEVFVSNTPIYDVNDRGGAVQSKEIKLVKYKAPFALNPGAVFSAVGGAISSLFSGNREYSANVLQWSTDFDAVSDTLGILEKLKADVQLVDVVLPSKVYENMFLEKIEVSRNAGTGSGARFSLSFREIRKVAVRLVNSPVPTQVRGSIPKPKGLQSPKVPGAPAAKKSVAKGLIDKLLGG
jgi:hypothetical protein